MQDNALNPIEIDQESNAWTSTAQCVSAQSAEGYLVSLNSLKITCGIGFGEKLTCATDIVVGDRLKLTKGSLSLPIHFEAFGDNKVAISLTHSDLGKDFVVAQATKTVTLMSDFGKIVRARVLEELGFSGGDTLLLLDQWIETDVEYTFITASELEFGSTSEEIA